MSRAGGDGPARPLAVRVLRAGGWIALGFGVLSLGIGALLRFDELAKIWAVVGGIALAIALTAFLGARRGRVGLACALVSCALMLLLPPGFLLTLVIAALASQDRAGLAGYYGLRRGAA